jgi:hypothetical protein
LPEKFSAFPCLAQRTTPKKEVKISGHAAAAAIVQLGLFTTNARTNADVEHHATTFAIAAKAAAVWHTNR